MAKIVVKDTTIRTMSKNGIDYICITDIARQKNSAEPKDVVKNRMRVKNTLEYLGLWESLNNPDFNGVEFDPIMRLTFWNQGVLSQCRQFLKAKKSVKSTLVTSVSLSWIPLLSEFQVSQRQLPLWTFRASAEKGKTVIEFPFLGRNVSGYGDRVLRVDCWSDRSWSIYQAFSSARAAERAASETSLPDIMAASSRMRSSTVS